MGQYREFVPNVAAVSEPLSDFLRRGQPTEVIWGEPQEQAYAPLKQYNMVSKPILHLLNFYEQFILSTDASDRAIGCVLGQLVNR